MKNRAEKLIELRKKATPGGWHTDGTTALFPPKPDNIGLVNRYSDADFFVYASHHAAQIAEAYLEVQTENTLLKKQLSRAIEALEHLECPVTLKDIEDYENTSD